MLVKLVRFLLVLGCAGFLMAPGLGWADVDDARPEGGGEGVVEQVSGEEVEAGEGVVEENQEPGAATEGEEGKTAPAEGDEVELGDGEQGGESGDDRVGEAEVAEAVEVEEEAGGEGEADTGVEVAEGEDTEDEAAVEEAQEAGDLVAGDDIREEAEHDSHDQVEDWEEVVEEESVVYYSTVQTSRYSISDAVDSASGHTRSEMEHIPLIDNDILRAITVFPSAQGDDFTARFSVRGGLSDETGIKLDGMELYEPYHLQDFGGAISVIGMNIVSEAELYAGAFPAIHGDNLSGMLDIRSRVGREDRFHGKFTLDLLSASVLLDGPLPSGSYLVSARRGYVDLFLKAWAPDLGFMPSYWDTFVRADHRFSARDTLTAYMIYTGDRNEMFHQGEQSQVTSKYDSFTSWLKYSRQFNGGHGGGLDIYLFGGTMLKNRFAAYGLLDDRELVFGGFKGELNLPLAGGSHIIQAGFRGRWMGGYYDYTNPRSVDLGRDTVQSLDLSLAERGIEGSLWIQDQWTISRFFMANGGVRMLGLTGGDSLMVEPRLSVAITPGAGFVLRGATGLHHQPITPLNLPVEVGGHGLGSKQRALHYVAGVEYRPARFPLMVKLEAFHKYYWDLIGIVPNLGREETAYISGEEAMVDGIEVYAQGRFGAGRGRFGWHGGYSLMKADEKLADGRVVPRDTDRRHSVTLGLDARLWKNGQVNLMWRYNSGVPYTEVLAIAEDGTRTYGVINGKYLPPCHSLDVRVSHGWKFNSWELSAYLQLMNAYNWDNVEEISYSRADDGSLAARNSHFLPLIPTFGISGTL